MSHTGYDRFVEHADEFTGKLSRRRRLRTMLMVAAPFFAIIMFTIALQRSGSDDLGLYDAAVSWADNGPESYELTYTITVADQELGPAEVVVTDDVVSSYRSDSPELEDHRVFTVEAALFTVEEVVEDPDAEMVSVTFDPDLGFPVDATFDPDPTRTGDEWSFHVVSFRPLTMAE